jgi:L-2-hydroxyglutarate oxidase LhgO
MNLKEMVATQEALITQLKQRNESAENSPIPQVAQLQQQSPQTTIPQLSRGIKVHNLIFTCPYFDPKEVNLREYIESILLEKFHRKPTINAVQLLPQKKSRQHWFIK